MRKGWILASGAALCLAAAKGDSTFPGPPGSDVWQNAPDDPDYATKQWNLYSTLPPHFVGGLAADEAGMGSGVRVDKAWQLHTGTPDTVIAILDSGIIWATPDVKDRVRLNTAALPLPEGSTVYDKNGDGRVSPSDWTGDSRVTASDGTGVPSGGDLIAAFGKDGTTEIAGWDVYEGRNNPEDRVQFGHGSGEATDSVGALNNGVAGAGVCGDCSFLPIRVGDSFVVDGNAFARAVIFAVDHGAAVIQEALGAENVSPFVQYALNYAYDHDVVVIGSAADEDSYHHNYPGTLDPVVYADAIRFDANDPTQASTFLNFNTCSNYGARVDVAVSALYCSSEATGILAGMAGLAQSYARSLGTKLTAGELIALIKTSATDINKGPNANDPTRWSTYEGWDQMTGYGRVDAFKMLDRIRTGDIPPEARILTPQWFEPVTAKDATIDVAVEARTPRSGTSKLKLEVARGVETSGTTWTLVQESPVLTDGFNGSFAKVATTMLAGLPANTRDQPHDLHSYTLRLTVDDLKGHVSEARRTFFWWQDEQLLPGFPVKLAGSGESTGLFIDVLGDGRTEYVTADGAGYVHAITRTGAELPGFPAATARSRFADPTRPGQDVQGAVVAPMAAGDLAGDGHIELVAVSLEGQISVTEADGRQRPGFPVSLPAPDMSEASPTQVIGPGVLAAPVLVDLRRDGHLDIVVMGLDGRVHAYGPDGQPMPGFPVDIEADGVRAKLASSPAVARDHNGNPVLIFGSNHVGAQAGYLFAVSGLGNDFGRPLLPGFPVKVPLLRDQVLPTVGTGVPASPVIADIGDGVPEIIIHGFLGRVWVVGLDGKLVRSLDIQIPTPPGGMGVGAEQYMLPAFGQPAVGDVTGTGALSPVAIGAGSQMLVALGAAGKRIPFQHMVGAWDGKSGKMLEGFPKINDDMALFVSPLIVDLEGTGKGDVIAASGGYWLHAWNSSGEAPGFPHFTGGWSFGSGAAGPLLGDGHLALAESTREGYVFAWQTQAQASPWQQARGWLTFKGNPQRTGER